MEPLIIAATEDTPEIVFHPEQGIFKISNISVPENAMGFYEPILDWLKKYETSPNPKTVFDLELEYINTASSKQIIQVILMLEKIAAKSEVNIRWFYDSIDEDMKALGERYKKLVKVNFELVET